MKLRLFLLLVLWGAFISICFSQTYVGQDASNLVNNADLIRIKNYSKVPNYIRFSENSTLSEQQTIAVVKSFITNANADLALKEVQINGDSSQTIRYYQTVSGYPIEFSALNLQVKNGRVSAVNGEILDNPAINPNFVISEAEALELALQFVNAELYMWQEDNTYLPQGEQVIVPDKINFGKSRLKSAYKFDIYSQKPHDRKMIYVDAETGEIILDLPLIHFQNVIGTAQTAYYGTRLISTEYNGSQYTLRDSTRGKGIFTYNANNSGSYSNTSDYTNDSTNWTNTPYGTDAHFSTMATYDYYLQKHGFNSIDNKGFALRSYVNFNLVEYGMGSNVNAFWNSSRGMTYGNGNPSQGITPLTSIDICGHEITHGLTQYTANLVYAYESGALNEAFSDIFGKAIEFYAVPQQANWLMGSMIGYTMRSMSNPKAYGSPNTYKGQYWVFGSSDNGGVHTNSGVLNYWFYLLCQGGSGTNDAGKSYNVTAIGMNKAEQIAFKLLTEYLTPSSEYEDAYFYAMQATASLFGGCSDEVNSVGNAFYAIGLIDKPYVKQAVADFSASSFESCSYPFTVNFSNKSYNCDTYLWNFGDGSPTSSLLNPSHTYTANGNYTVTLIVNSTNCGADTLIKQNFINISPNLPCVYFMTAGTQTIQGCHGFIYDDGGPNAPHSSNLTSRLTIYSPDADSIRLKFHVFELEACTSVNCVCDYLSVYIGNSISSSNLIGKYCGMNLPSSTITVKGEYVTLYFSSDPRVNLEGFEIEFFCISPNNPPIASFSADKTNSCNGIVKFEDQSIGTQINSWLWDFGDGRTSTLQNPTHQYYANGKYNVTLTVGNAKGQHTSTKINYIEIAMDKLDNHTFQGNKYQAFEVYIPDASANLKWYGNKEDNLWEKSPVFTGNPIQHPAIPNNKTYYVLDNYGGDEYKVGDTACSTKGSFFTANVEHYLIFDAYQKFTLQSVLVNAISNGNRTIMLRDSRQNEIWTKTVYVPAGKSRIKIDKEVPADVNLRLVCQSYPDLFRSDNTAALKYPYTIEDVVSIKSSSAGSPDALRYYYFFYDWEIKTPACNSELATVTITSGVGIQDNVLKNVSILPNPSSGIFRIENLQNIENYTITISEVTGKILNHTDLIKDNIIDLSHFASGLYFVRIDERVFKVVKY